MKKLFVALCALAMVALVACKKDKPTPSNNDPTPSEQRDTREGAYDPVCKITGIVYSDDTAPETWLWDPETGHLLSVNDDDYCGGYVERISFNYRNDGRVDYVNVRNLSLGDFLQNMEVDGTLQVTYNGDYISGLTVLNNGTQVLAAQVEHNSSTKKISGASIDLSDNMLLGLFNDLLTQFLGDSANSGDMITSVDNVIGNVLLTWDGNNVSQSLLSIGFRAATTLGTLVNLVGQDNLDMFGQYGSLLALAAAFAPNQPLYFNVTVADTVDYSYDDKVNPFFHYLGRIDISALSANNVVAAIHTGIAHVAITTSLNGQTTQFYETDYPLPLESTFNDYLEYNEAGCPLRMENSSGIQTEFHYAE